MQQFKSAEIDEERILGDQYSAVIFYVRMRS
jgi:hypothetical protein